MYITFEVVRWIVLVLVGFLVVKMSSRKIPSTFVYILTTVAAIIAGYALSYLVNADVLPSIYRGNVIAAYSELVGVLIVFVIQLAIKKKLAIIVEPVLSMILSIVVIKNSNLEYENSLSGLLLILATALLILNIYMFYMMAFDPDYKMAAQKKELMDMHADNLKVLYEQISEEHKTIKGREHEYKNTIAYISALAQRGDYETLKEYLSQEQNSIEQNTSIVDTGNKVISTVFNAKYSEAKRHGIQVRFSMNSLSGMNYDDRDLVILISNLFNNAIEACDRIESTDKIIKVNMNNSSSGFCVSFSNPCEAVLDNYATTKDDKSIHGFGLTNISEIAQKYNGITDIETANGWFTIRVMMM